MGLKRECCVGGCNATKEQLFCFPTKDKLRSLWMSFLVPTNPRLVGLSKEQLLRKRVCKKHFDQYQFDRIGKRILYSYPCLFTDDEIAHGVPLPAPGTVRDALSDHNYFKDNNDEGDLTGATLVIGRPGENFHEHPSCLHSKSVSSTQEDKGIGVIAAVVTDVSLSLETACIEEEAGVVCVKTEPGEECVKTECAVQFVKTEPAVQCIKTEPAVRCVKREPGVVEYIKTESGVEYMITEPRLDCNTAIPGVECVKTEPGVEYIITEPRVDCNTAIPGVEFVEIELGVDYMITEPRLDCKTAIPGVECVKTEPGVECKEELKRSDSSWGVNEAAPWTDLYADHQIKDEFCLGPEVRHRPQVTAVSGTVDGCGGPGAVLCGVSDEAPHASHTSPATSHESRRASRMKETHDNTAGLRAEEAYIHKRIHTEIKP